MAVGQENKGKKKEFHDFFRMAEKRKAQADNSEFLTDESPNAAKHWGSECQKSGGAGGTVSCRGYRGGAPNPCATALSPQTTLRVRSTEDEDSPKGYRSPKPATPSGGAGRKALFAGAGGQLGVFRQTEPPFLERGRRREISKQIEIPEKMFQNHLSPQCGGNDGKNHQGGQCDADHPHQNGFPPGPFILETCHIQRPPCHTLGSV